MAKANSHSCTREPFPVFQSIPLLIGVFHALVMLQITFPLAEPLLGQENRSNQPRHVWSEGLPLFTCVFFFLTEALGTSWPRHRARRDRVYGACKVHITHFSQDLAGGPWQWQLNAQLGALTSSSQPPGFVWDLRYSSTLPSARSAP